MTLRFAKYQHIFILLPSILYCCITSKLAGLGFVLQRQVGKDRDRDAPHSHLRQFIARLLHGNDHQCNIHVATGSLVTV